MTDILKVQSQAKAAYQSAEKYARHLMKTDTRGATEIQNAFLTMARAVIDLSEVVAAQQDEIQKLKDRDRPGYLAP